MYVEVPVRYRRRIGVSKVSGTFKGTLMAGYKILTWIGQLLDPHLYLETPEEIIGPNFVKLLKKRGIELF